jgi:hypothetical protein
VRREKDECMERIVPADAGGRPLIGSSQVFICPFWTNDVFTVPVDYFGSLLLVFVRSSNNKQSCGL